MEVSRRCGDVGRYVAPNSKSPFESLQYPQLPMDSCVRFNLKWPVWLIRVRFKCVTRVRRFVKPDLSCSNMMYRASRGSSGNTSNGHS